MIGRRDAVDLLASHKERVRAMETRAHPYYRLPPRTLDVAYIDAPDESGWMADTGMTAVAYGFRSGLGIVQVKANATMDNPPSLISIIPLHPVAEQSGIARFGQTVTVGTNGHVTWSGTIDVGGVLAVSFVFAA